MSRVVLEAGIQQLVREFIEAGRPSSAQMPVSERREGYIRSTVLAGPTKSIYKVEDRQCDEIPLRLYYGAAGSDLPVLVYFHGGCFVSGGFATHDQQLREIAHQSGAIVVAVQYRLAPEHVYPAAHDDALRVANHVYHSCTEWGGSPEKLMLAGDSAGGHLALVTCLRLRDLGEWLPSKQILIYPMLDAHGSSASYQRFGEDYVITRDTLLSGFDMYLSGSGVAKSHPEISPLHRLDLQGLPETHIMTAECDPLRDEGEDLYRRLINAGVQAQCRRYLGVIHGFFQLSGISPAARECVTQVASILRQTG